MSKVCVLGPGSWGTTLAVHLATAGHEVQLWGHDAGELAALEADRENRKFYLASRCPIALRFARNSSPHFRAPSFPCSSCPLK